MRKTNRSRYLREFKAKVAIVATMVDIRDVNEI